MISMFHPPPAQNLITPCTTPCRITSSTGTNQQSGSATTGRTPSPEPAVPELVEGVGRAINIHVGEGDGDGVAVGVFSAAGVLVAVSVPELAEGVTVGVFVAGDGVSVGVAVSVTEPVEGVEVAV